MDYDKILYNYEEGNKIKDEKPKKRWAPTDWELDSIIMTSLGSSQLSVPSLAEYAAMALIGLLGFLLFRSRINSSSTIPIVSLCIYVTLCLIEFAISFLGDTKLFWVLISIVVAKAITGGLFSIYISSQGSWAFLFLRKNR